MSIALEVVRHDITDEYTWPQDVVKLFRSFSRPLPKLLASNEFQMVLPLRTREMLGMALQSPVVVLEDEKSEIEETRPVTDVIDTILSSVRMVRAASAFGREPGHEQARLSWTTLITMLGISISDNVYFSEDVSFLMPRTTTRSTPMDSKDLEGKAVILLSTFISRCIRPEPDVNGSSGNKSEASIGSSGCAPEDPFVSLDLPLDAFVIPGRGKRVECCLPVVCAADEEEIDPLVTSVVCQRYVWNIPIPVVGVSLSKSGTTATIVIGWSEVDTGSHDGSPIIHLVRSQRDDILPSLGLFDLLDPVSALYFGQFILGCRVHFAKIEQLSKNRAMRDLCWRLDHVHHISPYCSPNKSDTLVENWLLNLPSAANAGPSIFHRLHSLFAFMSSSKPSSSGKNRSASNDYLQVPSLHRSASGSSLAKSYSASEFAALRAENGFAAMEPGTDTWLWERCTLRLFRLRLPMDVKSDFSKQFNGMIDLYDQLTEFRWPEEWKSDKTFPPYCDRPSQGQRADLFMEYRQYINDNPTPPNLEPDVTASVADHMTTFLRAVSTSQASRRQDAFSGAGESAMRSAWDELFKAACCEPSVDVSNTYFVEKSIGMPKNQAFGNADFPDVFQSRLLFLLLMKQSGIAPVDQPAIANGVLFAAQQAASNKERSESSPQPIQDRSFEPSTALVDGLYCLEYVVDQAVMGRKPADKFPGWFRSFFTLFKNPSNPKCTKGRTHTFEYQEPSTKLTKTMTFNDAHAECYMCPEVTKSLPNPSPFSVKDDKFLRFYFPFIYVENKRATKSLRQALHQCQMYCIFGVEFLAALGITDFPVFGVITAGTEGEIIMAWKSSKSVEVDYRSSYRAEKVPRADPRHWYNILIDQNCKKFDLSSPLQAFHFYISIHRIYKRQELLAKEVRKKSTELARIWKDPQNELHNWMMAPKVRATRKPTSKTEPTSK